MSSYPDTDKLGTIYTVVRIPRHGVGYPVTTETEHRLAVKAKEHNEGKYPDQDFEYRIDTYRRHKRGVTADKTTESTEQTDGQTDTETPDDTTEVQA